MDFFNKVGSSLTSLANGASAKTKNMMDLSTLNNQLRQHEDTLKGLYETIGRQYYAEKQGKAEEAYAEIFGQVETIETTAAELRKKIEINKSMVTCPKCGGLTENTSRFCKNCGNPMQAAAVQQTAAPQQMPVQQTPVASVPVSGNSAQQVETTINMAPPIPVASDTIPPISASSNVAEEKDEAGEASAEKAGQDNAEKKEDSVDSES